MLLLAPGVGVKRSREQTNHPAAAAAEVRPALDDDPAELAHGPTMDNEGRGTSPPATNSRAPERLTERPPSLLPGPFSSQSAESRIPACSHDAFTHGMFGDEPPGQLWAHDMGHGVAITLAVDGAPNIQICIDVTG